MKHFKKILYVIIWILPFVLGTLGYCVENENVIDALYDAFALYAINPVSDASNWMIVIAKWGAPMVLASGILIALQSLLNYLKEVFISLHKGATAVYSDNEYGSILKENMEYGILASDARLRDVQDHVLLFANDIDNLNFYQKNKERLKGKNVYMQLNEIDSFLLRENSIRFFNLNELVARQYWKEYHLVDYFSEKETVIRIAIIGFSQLGQQILNYGILNNIYKLDQHIEYHIWGDSILYQHMHEHLELMNQDSIIYHGVTWEDDVAKLGMMNRIIITENQIKILQTLMYMCDKSEIYYYNSGEAVIEEIFSRKNMVSFGNYSDILTEHNIKSDTLYRAGKELNYKYACLYGNVSGDEAKKEQEMEEQWEMLDGFTKGSNIASADYHYIRRLLMKKAKERGEELSEECLGRMEHIRWCRYHYINHWKYGIPENGKNKDAERRIHVCLLPFDELKIEDKLKDFEAVEVLIEGEE